MNHIDRIEDFVPIDRYEPGKTTKVDFSATSYHWTDPANLPSRQWLYGYHLIRGQVSVTVAPGGVGKSSLGIVEALSMATGMELLGQQINAPLKVWLWNLEDPRDELARRIQAACQYYSITATDFAGRLYIDTGREQELCTAITGRHGAVIQEPVIDQLIDQISDAQIDVLMVDPFVSSHSVSENDNAAIDAIAKTWGRVADRAGCAISLVHHTRKQSETEVNADSARGAKALIDAARDVRALNRMSADEATKAGVDNARLYFRVYSDKVNLAPPSEKSDWYKLESVKLVNGDSVGVVTPWKWPDPFTDITVANLRAVQQAIHGKQYRKDVRSNDWIGNQIAEVIGADLSEESDQSKVKYLLKTWIENGALVARQVVTESRNKAWIVEVGEWAA